MTHEDARRYLVAIQDTLDRHGWSKHEREHLRRLKVRWARRVAGLDPRFEAMGVQGGVSERFRPPTRMDALHTLRRELMPFKTVSESWPFGSPRVRGLDLLLQ